MTSIDWMPNGGAPLLPKASPYCVPVKMMELKRRPTIYDLRGASWQLRHKRARPGDEVPWDRVFNWPPKSMHVITPQELYTPDKRKKKRAAKKGPKVVKAPPTPADRKFAAKFAVRFDLQRVVRYLKASADKRAVKAASADAAKAPTTTPVTRRIFSRPLVPGAFPGDGDDAAADIDAQTQSAANDKAQPSLLAAMFKFAKFAFGLFFGSGESKKRVLEDDDEAGDAKRRRVGSDAQAPARAEARPVAGKPARTTPTGAPAPTHHYSTTNAAKRRVRIAPPASLKLCPPPSGSKSVVGNAKVVEALLMPPPFARPIAGRPTRKRADTPDPGAGTPPPSASRATAEPEASSRSSTPTSSPSSSGESSPEREPAPSPAPKESSSKSKSKSKSSKTKSSSSKAKSSSSNSHSSSSNSHSSSSESESESGPQASSSKSKAKSKSKSSSKSTSKPSSSKTTSKSSSSGSSSSSSDTTSSSSASESSSSDSESRSSKHRHSRKYQPFSDDPNVQSDFLFSTGTNIVLFPHTMRWTRDGEQVNPWDPHCPAPPDPLFPWAPVGSKWAQARPAPIATSSSAAATTISFQHPSTFCDSARAPPAAAAPASRDRAASSAFDDLSGDETEVDSGAETDDEED